MQHRADMMLTGVDWHEEIASTIDSAHPLFVKSENCGQVAVRNDIDQRLAIFRRGCAIQVTRDGGFAPLESPDGKFVYYVKSLADCSLWRTTVNGGPATKILEGVSNYLNLAIVDSGVFFVPTRNTTAGSSIQFLSFATNRIRPVANFDKPLDIGGGFGGVSVSSDGRWILYTQFEAGSELMLVENFR